MAKMWKNRASLSSHNISQNLHPYFTSALGYPAGARELLVLGWELRLSSFMPFINSLGAFKGPKKYGST